MRICYKSVVIFFLLLIEQSCRIPRHTLILSNDNSVYNEKKFSEIPKNWDGRLLAMGTYFHVGGESEHRHSIQHKHIDTSEGPNLTVQPLGLERPTSSGVHQHIVTSYFQSPVFSSLSRYQPLSKELNVYITKHGINKIPEGVILLYIGKDIPTGWLKCDGTNNTPDLRNVYVKLKQKDCSKVPSGNNSHIHSVNHSHKWSVNTPENISSPNINEAVAGDEMQRPGDTIPINEFNHIHGVVEEKLKDTFTIPKEIFPPSISVCFIQSEKYSKKIPRNAILPTLKTYRPWGWLKWNPATNSIECFIYGAMDDSKILNQFGSVSHSHIFDHTHKLILTSVPHYVSRVSKDDGPPVSLYNHTHEVYAHKVVQTDTSNSLPLFASFKFIIKK